MTEALILEDPAAPYAEALAAVAHDVVATTATDPGAVDPAACPPVWLARPDLAAALVARGARPAWIQSSWAGVGPLIAPARRHGIVVTGIKGLFGPLISEYVFGHLLADVRRTDAYRAAQREWRWLSEWPDTLRDKTLTVLGTGSIGAHLAATARHFGMSTRGVSRSGAAVAGFDAVASARSRTALHAALDADYVVACLPATAATERLVDAAAFAAMRRNTLFLNVGRAATVDHAALLEALRRGGIRGAVLDVFDVEPLPADDPLWRAPGITVTPHVAGVSYPADVARYFAANVERYRAREALAGRVDLERGY